MTNIRIKHKGNDVYLFSGFRKPNEIDADDLLAVLLNPDGYIIEPEKEEFFIKSAQELRKWYAQEIQRAEIRGFNEGYIAGVVDSESKENENDRKQKGR